MVVNWKEGLSEEQISAAQFKGSHARLLAGPGTGKSKTLTHRILALIIEYDVDPSKILVLTFTRVAAYQLKQEVQIILEPLKKGYPYVSTLHSFALRQLLRNSQLIDSLPHPLRIADDWEERRLIQEDIRLDIESHLKSILGEIHAPIFKVQHLFNQLSSDWETLRADLDTSQRMCCDPKFIGAWTTHRKIFSYTLRAELVYQLKKALNQYPDFELEAGFEYVMIDEYQDLNACDLSVVKELSKRGCELYVAGDDDQSIYGFRFADPTGIRVFPERYNAEDLKLTTCYRCDQSILDIGQFIADLDVNRLQKLIIPKSNSSRGVVRLQCYDNQLAEAYGVANRCAEILETDDSTEILILMRSDHNNLISNTLIKAMDKAGIPTALATEGCPLDSDDGRYLLTVLRLIANPNDSLAQRTVLELQCPGVGPDTQKILRVKASNLALNYSRVVSAVKDGKIKVNRGEKIKKTLRSIDKLIEKHKTSDKPPSEFIDDVIVDTIADPEERKSIGDYLKRIMVEVTPDNLTALLQSISSSMSCAEQELEAGKVNVMTMHRAKGLSADVVFVIGAEKQFIPGKNIGLGEGDERRLLYVSLTRARHELIITYCKKRVEQQRYTGSESGTARRELTPFLRNAPLKVEYIRF